jgi:hypothetical protein
LRLNDGRTASATKGRPSFEDSPFIDRNLSRRKIYPNDRANHLALPHLWKNRAGGGMGVVYKAEDVRLQRFVAPKIPFRRRCRRTLGAHAFCPRSPSCFRAQPSQISTICDIGEQDGLAFIAMAYPDGIVLKPPHCRTSTRNRIASLPVPCNRRRARCRSRRRQHSSRFKNRQRLQRQARDALKSCDPNLSLYNFSGLRSLAAVVLLQGESASFKSDEALKAMAVAARTYAVHFGSRHHLEDFDFCDTTHRQDARLGNESPRARAAVAATAGRLLWFEGAPVATYYHRSCAEAAEK